MVCESNSPLLRDLLVTTKDGDWGKEHPEEGFVPYHIIRGTDFPAVRVGDLSSVPLRYLPEHTVKRRTLEPDDILIETAGGTRDRPTGRTLLVTEKILSRFRGPATCASFARYLRIDRKLADPRFIFWYLQHLYNKGEMSQHQVQHTGVARFQYTRFSDTQNVPLPPLYEQKAIASILGTLDDKIELNRRTNATLEAMARALFQSWFVDFDPVRAKRDGRPPPLLDPATAALFPDSFQDSELGQIPKGWKVVSLEDVALIRGGKQLPAAECLTDGKFTVFGANGVMGYASESTHEGFVIAFGRVGAYCGSIHWSVDGAWINNNASAVVPLQCPALVLQTMMNIEFDSMRTGSAQPFIPNSSLASAKVLRPSMELANLFSLIVEPWRRQQSDNDKHSRTLTTLRDKLLPKLLSRDLRIDESGL